MSTRKLTKIIVLTAVASFILIFVLMNFAQAQASTCQGTLSFRMEGKPGDTIDIRVLKDGSAIDITNTETGVTAKTITLVRDTGKYVITHIACAPTGTFILETTQHYVGNGGGNPLFVYMNGELLTKITLNSNKNNVAETFDMTDLAHSSCSYDCSQDIIALSSTELCDGFDNTCNGIVDEGCCENGATDSCTITQSGTAVSGARLCENSAWGTCIPLTVQSLAAASSTNLLNLQLAASSITSCQDSTVTLGVKGTSSSLVTTVPVDVVLVIDISGSMDWYSTLIDYSSNSISASGEQLVKTLTIDNTNNPDHDFDAVFEWTSGNGLSSTKLVSPSGKSYSTTTAYTTARRTVINGAKWESGTWSLYATKSSGSSSQDFFLTVSAPDDKITATKNAANFFLGQLTSNDQSSLVTFSTSGNLIKTLTSSHSAVQSAVSGISANGGTAIGEGIKTAITELTSSRVRLNSNKVIVLLSDGVSNSGTYSSLTAAQTAASDNIKIYSIGLGSSAGASELSAIAAAASGTYYPSPSSVQLQGVYNSIVSTVASVVANNVNVNFKIPASLSYVSGTSTKDGAASEPDTTSQSGYLIWNLGQVSKDQQKTIVFHLHPSSSGIYSMGDQSTATYTDPSNSAQSEDFVPVDLLVSGCGGIITPPICSNNQIESCDTGLLGECAAGQRTCANGAWGSCIQTKQPSAETCDGKDNNCDGIIDFTSRECSITNSFGTCTGSEQCSSGTFTSCDAQTPAAEICGDGIDNDCNNLIDCADPACDGSPSCPCNPTKSQAHECGNTFCPGTMTCGSDGQWDPTTCTARTPTDFETCNDNIDNNCNGMTDCEEPSCIGNSPNCICVPATTMPCGNDVCPGTMTCASNYQWDPATCTGDSTCVCTAGNTEVCSDGACQGNKVCGADNQWGACDANTPASEGKNFTGTCGDNIDNDCNGLKDCDDPACDGDPSCECKSGDKKPCGNDVCPGEESCGADNLWDPSTCTGSDDCACTAGQTEPCSDTNDFGTCTGTKTCGADNQFGLCSAATPVDEICGNTADDNCNGLIDCQEDSCKGTSGCPFTCEASANPLDFVFAQSKDEFPRQRLAIIPPIDVDFGIAKIGAYSNGFDVSLASQMIISNCAMDTIGGTGTSERLFSEYFENPTIAPSESNPALPYSNTFTFVFKNDAIAKIINKGADPEFSVFECLDNLHVTCSVKIKKNLLYNSNPTSTDCFENKTLSFNVTFSDPMPDKLVKSTLREEQSFQDNFSNSIITAYNVFKGIQDVCSVLPRASSTLESVGAPIAVVGSVMAKIPVIKTIGEGVFKAGRAVYNTGVNIEYNIYRKKFTKSTASSAVPISLFGVSVAETYKPDSFQSICKLLTCGVKTTEMKFFQTTMTDITSATDPNKILDKVFNPSSSSSSACGGSSGSPLTQSYILDLGSFCVTDLLREAKFYADQKCNYEKCLYEQAMGTRDATENCNEALRVAMCTRWTEKFYNVLASIGGQYSLKSFVGIYSKWTSFIMDLPEILLDKGYNTICGATGGGFTEGADGKIVEIKESVNVGKLLLCNVPKAYISGKRLYEELFPLAENGPCMLDPTTKKPVIVGKDRCIMDPFAGLFKFDEKCTFVTTPIHDKAACPVKYPIQEEY